MKPADDFFKHTPLTKLQRILLITDGTLTDLLEALFNESIQVIKLKEYCEFTETVAGLKLRGKQKILFREILLQGKTSKKNHVYAQSTILLNQLSNDFQAQLLNSSIPIGKLWFEAKIETFKEITQTWSEPAKNLAQYFEIDTEETLLCRTYRVINNQQPVMMITEKFPALKYK